MYSGTFRILERCPPILSKIHTSLFTHVWPLNVTFENAFVNIPSNIIYQNFSNGQLRGLLNTSMKVDPKFTPRSNVKLLIMDKIIVKCLTAA